MNVSNHPSHGGYAHLEIAWSVTRYSYVCIYILILISIYIYNINIYIIYICVYTVYTNIYISLCIYVYIYIYIYVCLPNSLVHEFHQDLKTTMIKNCHLQGVSSWNSVADLIMRSDYPFTSQFNSLS